MRRIIIALVGILVLLAYGPAQADMTLKLSHQWSPGDIRSKTAQVFADKVEAADVGIKIQIYPASSLFKPDSQWPALVRGRLDLAIFPLDYASGRHPGFSATLMPGLVRSYDRAQRLDDSKFMGMIKDTMNKAGVRVLTDIWLSGGFASNKHCITDPSSVDGLTMRAAGPYFEKMLAAAGASITSMPSSQIYTALQTGVIDGANTSSGSFLSYRIYEQVSCLTAPGDNALWFMYEPLVISQSTWKQLSKEQQKALTAAGNKAEKYFFKHAKKLDQKLVDVFSENGVKVITLSKDQYQAWIDLAKESSYKSFAETVPNGQELLNAAQEVE